MKAVVAVDNEWGIGNKGDLLARVRADLMNFRRLTDGRTVVLGSNTLATFPGGRVLKNRVNVVLHPDASYAPEGATVAHSLDEALRIVAQGDADNTFVIGGASIYRQFLPYCDTVYVTKFKKSYEKDVYFENLDESPEWELFSESEPMKSDPERDTDPDLEYTFCEYRRVLKPILIREATESDSSELYRLLKIVADTHRAIRPDVMEGKESKYTVEEIEDLIRIEKQSNNTVGAVFVAECDGVVCGHVFCSVNAAMDKTVYVDDLCVDPAFRRRGAATKLMDRVAAYGREQGCVSITLHVWNGNSAAQAFYDVYGMTERAKQLEKRL